MVKLLGVNDKLYLSVINFVSKDYKILPLNFKLPLEDENLDISDDIIKASVFEYNESDYVSGRVVFNIYVGKQSTLRDILNKFSDERITVENIQALNSVEESVCYFEDLSGSLVIFASLEDNDIVVSDVEELKQVIIELSHNFMEIKNGISRIRKLSYVNLI